MVRITKTEACIRDDMNIAEFIYCITLRYLEEYDIHPLLRAFGVQLSVFDTGREGIEGKGVPFLRLSIHSASF